MLKKTMIVMMLGAASALIMPALGAGGGPGGFGQAFGDGPGGFNGPPDMGGPGDFGPAGFGGRGRGRGGRGGRGGPGGQGGMDNRYLVADLQQPLGANSEEWKIISPMLARVVAGENALVATADSGNDGGGPGGDFGGGRGRGGDRGGNDTFAGPASTADGGRGRGRGWGGNFAGMGGPDMTGGQQQGSGAANQPAVSSGSAISPGVSASASNRITLPQALADLGTALTAPNTTEDQLKERVAVVRDARRKTEADVRAAKKELLQILTLDQQATLVALGYMD